MKDDAYQKALERIEQAAENQDTELDLSKFGLTELPPEIGQLQALTKLNLNTNQLLIFRPVPRPKPGLPKSCEMGKYSKSKA